MNTLKKSYQEVLDHLAADIETLQQGGQISDMATLSQFQERHDWLVSRKNRLNEQRKQIISGLKNRLDAYLCQCEGFWKSNQTRTYEKKMYQLHDTRLRVIRIYSLTGWSACYALMLTLKHLRSILPLPQYAEYAPALAALESIKNDCYEQVASYLKINENCVT